jgi:hypothetical protein
LALYAEGKKFSLIACPIVDNGIDIIYFDSVAESSDYVFGFEGLVIITNNKKRTLYHKGNILAATTRD